MTGKRQGLESTTHTTVSAGPVVADGPALTHIEDLARLGERLRSALADAIQGLPMEMRTANRLPDALGVDRSTCYRLWRASQISSGHWAEAILSLPGTSAMRSFVTAVKRRRLSAGLIDGFESAVDQFDAFVRDKYRSHTRLKELLRQMPSSQPSAAESAPSSIRAALYRNAAAVSRSSIDLDGAIVLVMPARRPDCVAEVAMLIAYLGFRASPGGRPLVVHVGSHHEHPLTRSDAGGAGASGGLEIRDTDGDSIIGRNNHCVVPEFSSHPLPTVLRERSVSQEVARLCIDVSDANQVRDGFDVVTAFRLDPIPLKSDQVQAPFRGFVKNIDHPTGNLVVDAYLHRSFARRSIPEASCFAPPPSWMADSEHARWAYRLPEHPDLRILPNDLVTARDAVWPRYSEMATLLFERCGVAREDYVGHRMSTRYPVWLTSYKLAFDYE